jgi:hypothetical protein
MNYKSNSAYKNRYGDKFEFVSTDSPTRFLLEGELSHFRYGGKEGQEGVDLLDLGMIDPSGGPLLSLDTEIDAKKITKISVYSEVIMLETESES